MRQYLFIQLNYLYTVCVGMCTFDQKSLYLLVIRKLITEQPQIWVSDEFLIDDD